MDPCHSDLHVIGQLPLSLSLLNISPYLGYVLYPFSSFLFHGLLTLIVYTLPLLKCGSLYRHIPTLVVKLCICLQ
jgi:hypothetical protein